MLILKKSSLTKLKRGFIFCQTAILSMHAWVTWYTHTVAAATRGVFVSHSEVFGS